MVQVRAIERRRTSTAAGGDNSVVDLAGLGDRALESIDGYNMELISPSLGAIDLGSPGFIG